MKNKLKYLFMLMIIVVSVVGCKSKKENEKPLVVAMELAYPPFEMKDLNGDPSGISVDFAKDFGKYINRDDIVIDGGKSPIGEASTIIDMSNENIKILREGSISKEDIEKIIGKI